MELPNVTVKTEAKNVPYDGEAYEEANIIVAEKTLPGDVVPGAYEYARNEQFSGATENAPTDAGDYFVRRSYTYNADNYAVVGSHSLRLPHHPPSRTHDDVYRRGGNSNLHRPGHTPAAG